MRGDAQRAMIRAVVDALGDDAEHMVFLGGCALALYARKVGAPLRTTTDVDCITGRSPLVQEYAVAELCRRRVLVPDETIECRYRIRGTDFDVDILLPGRNVPNGAWFEGAVRHASVRDAGAGYRVRVVSPPFLLLLKLAALLERGELLSHTFAPRDLR